VEYAGESPGNGPKTRTAWAGVGDGVLFHDAGGDGQITEDREFVFTEWNPKAEDERTALRAQGGASEFRCLRGIKEVNGLRGRIHLTSKNWCGWVVRLVSATMLGVSVPPRGVEYSIQSERFWREYTG